MIFIQKCALRKTCLPAIPCECTDCEWYVNDDSYNNCFWLLAYFLYENPGYRFTDKEISQLEGISVEEVEEIIEGALCKLRQRAKDFIKDDIDAT